MIVPTLHGDRWSGADDASWQVVDPTWDDAQQAIERLDATVFTLVTIGGPGEQHLTIGGGSGRYVVYATFDNWDFWNLLGANPDGAPILLNAGGQEGDYPARQVVDKDRALRAARTFFTSLQLDPTLQWEQQ